MKSGFYTHRNSILHYVEDGEASSPPLIFVHAFPFSHEMWTGQIKEAAKICHTIAYDVRGHGQSTIGDGQYTIEGHVDDLIAFMDYLHIQQAMIAGLSMGGYIALRALERHPERFSAAILCDTRSEADTDEGKIKRAAGVKRVKEIGSAAFADELLKNLLAPATFSSKPEVVSVCRSIIAKNSPLAIAGSLLALASRTDTSASLERLKIPALILVGEHDATTPPALSAAMHQRIAGSEIHIIPGAGHLSSLENPTAFNEFLLDFLKRVVNTDARRV